MMKTNQLLTFYFLLFCATTLIGQQSATLYCDIEALLDGDDPAEVCEFVEAPGENPENFTIEATLEEEITWSGQDGILITKVKWYKGPKIFNGKNPSGNGVIKAKPKKTTPDDDPYRYKLKFSVNGQGNYKIDPIIRVRE